MKRILSKSYALHEITFFPLGFSWIFTNPVLVFCVQGATIPQCANGTNLLIPLPGAISEEDMAITGAGTRLHTQDGSCLSLLYDFEELEGELDFLSRVVALTFYPSATANGPMTLGEVRREKLC